MDNSDIKLAEVIWAAGADRFEKLRPMLAPSTVVKVMTGEELKAEYIDAPAPVVIIDISLGVDTVKMISNRRDDADVLVLVSKDKIHDVPSFMEIGVMGYIYEDVKPGIPALLIDRLVYRRKILDMIQEKEELLQSIMDKSTNYVAVYSDRGLEYINKRLQSELGTSDIKELNKQLGGRITYFDIDNAMFRNYEELIVWADHNLPLPEGHTIHMNVKGEERTFILAVHRMPLGKEFLFILTDISFVQKEKQYYKDMAEYDHLTKAFSRSKINQEIEKEIERAERYGQKFSVLMMDIDRFKRVNDTYGHQVGDEVLIAIADTVRLRIRKTDVFGRHGGEEFLVVLPSTGIVEASDLAERLREAIAGIKHKNVPKAVTISIGVAEYELPENLSSLVSRADAMLYKAKNTGRNKVAVYGED